MKKRLPPWCKLVKHTLIDRDMYCCHKPYQIIGHIMDEDILAKKMEAVTDMSMCDIPCRMTAPNLEVKKMEQARKDACFI